MRGGRVVGRGRIGRERKRGDCRSGKMDEGGALLPSEKKTKKKN